MKCCASFGSNLDQTRDSTSHRCFGSRFPKVDKIIPSSSKGKEQLEHADAMRHWTVCLKRQVLIKSRWKSRSQSRTSLGVYFEMQLEKNVRRMLSILTLPAAWWTLTSTAASTFAIKQAAQFHPLPRRAPCSLQPTFQLNEAAWTAANTDAQFQAWWDNTTLGQNGSKSSQLAAEYGPHLNNFACGINLISTCTQASCDGRLFGSGHIDSMT